MNIEHKKLQLNIGGQSIAGVKESNEDAFTAMMPNEHAVRKYKGAAACIADGVSCSSNAQMASQTAVTNFISDYYSTPDFWTVKQSASKVISSINSWLFQQGLQTQTRSDGFVTTFSALIIKSHTAHLLHAGNSRIYLLRENQLELLTRDHCYKRAGEDILVKSLGIGPQLELDYRTIKAQKGDRFILTTDGVHDSLTHQQLEELSKTSKDLESIAKDIINASLANNSQDNISCLLLEVESLATERLQELHQNLSQLTIPPALNVGNKIDHFEIIRSLHSGTRSHVYLARDTNNDEKVVLKMPSINASDDIAYLEAFAREQWIGRKLNHSNIMKIHPPIESSEFLYHHCQFIPGITLRQWIIDHPRPTIENVRDILEGMIQAVRVLHRNKMVHRDLKPENFIIDRDNRVSLIDFGTIKIAGIDEIELPETHHGPVGDLNYCAPETLIYNATNSATDLFSIATIVYEMISSKLPFNANNSNRSISRNIKHWNYKPLNTLEDSRDDIPLWVDAVLAKALSPNPNSRFLAMSEFQQELCSPSNSTLKSIDTKPLIERNPLIFWKAMSLGLFVLIIVQWCLMVS